MKNSLIFVLFAFLNATGANAMSLTVSASVPSPAPVGTKVIFSAQVSEAGKNLWYRFRVRDQGGDYRMLRDFGPVSSLDWTAVDHEGGYDVEVTVRDLDSGDSAATFVGYQFTPRATSGQAVVSPTGHPLVFLYSAPGCTPGQSMRVEFSGPDGILQHTPFRDCDGRSMNFYLAGLRAQTTYSAQHLEESWKPNYSPRRWMQVDGIAPSASSEAVTFTTGSLPQGLYNDSIVIASPSGVSDNVLLGSAMARSAVAHDLAGNVIWYGPSDLAYITRVEAGGYFWGLVGVPGGTTAQQLVRKLDLTGRTLVETNAARVNEQLLAKGKRPITAFHHEAAPLPNGRLAVLGGVEQIVTDTQGSGPVDVVSDMIVVLDQDLNVVWSWDAFDHLDIHRMAILDEKCPGACPPMLLAKTGNDWTHGNSVQLTPDGNLIYSARHQDWLIKISYDDSNGDGRILWRLGKDGDFTIRSTDSYPWFSHQHDPNFEPAEGNNTPRYRSARQLPQLMLFDNGNTRVASQGGGNSRGQVFEVDEVNRVVTPVLNADLGMYSFAVGSARRLADGNYHFDAGYVRETSGVSSHALEVTPSGKIVYDAGANTTLYRSFRMSDMYTPN